MLSHRRQRRGTGRIVDRQRDQFHGGGQFDHRGPTDWIHWGDASLNRKAGGGAQISTYAVVGAGSAGAYGNDLRPLSWTDGTPTASSINNTNGLYV